MATPLTCARGTKPILALLLGIALAAPALGAAQSSCAVKKNDAAHARWAPPLDRFITLRVGSVPLKVALDKLAVAAALRVSYSREQLPLSRNVCASFQGVALGDVLQAILHDVPVEAVVAGADHVVLTPRLVQTAVAQEPIAKPVYPIEPLIATAIPAQTEQSTQVAGVTVLGRNQIEREGSIGGALRNVPGVWVWQSAAGMTTQFTMRGATSFGVSSPKVYIDGIEVANPLLAAQLMPENVERIEVIRGPQGAALYGADALNGVTNIVTRHETSQDGAPRLRVRSELAVATSNFIQQTGLGHDHFVSLQLGSRQRSGAFNFGIGSVGEYMPGAYARNVNVDGSLRLVSERTLITGTARFYSKSAGNPAGLITDSLPPGSPLSMQQYTVGARMLYRPNDRVMHTLVVGADGYALDGISDTQATQSVTDSVLRAAGDGALRVTARFSTMAHMTTSTNAATSITLAAEHSNLQQHGDLAAATLTGGFMPARKGSKAGMPRQTSLVGGTDNQAALTRYDQARASNGISAQMDGTFFQRVSVSGGLRLQRDDVNGSSATSMLPMLGASYQSGGREHGIRFRTAYGKAIRWPSIPVTGWDSDPQLSRPALAPEQQAGLEAGIDVTLGPVALQVTRFDQVATGLMQSVALLDENPEDGNPLPTRYALQSVGEIANNGWELQASVNHGPLALTGTMSFVSSRVLHVADGYTGDLRAGDRMLAVPARTASLQASWSGSGWSTALTAARAFDWINYDRLALSAQPDDVFGVGLRAYWKQYSGATNLRASLSRNINTRLLLTLTGDNLLNSQTGQPDNSTVVPGRTISFGVRAAF
jgi:iron complex outermembrane recepter protein